MNKICFLILVLSVVACGVQDEHTVAPAPYEPDLWVYWVDQDNDCQTEQQEALISRSAREVSYTNDDLCIVATGEWIAPYTGTGWENAKDVYVDHVVSLQWAHNHGGALWAAERKQQFANDAVNLVITENRLKQEKAGKGPSQWIPPNEKFHCMYADIWRRVIDEYELSPGLIDVQSLHVLSDGCH